MLNFRSWRRLGILWSLYWSCPVHVRHGHSVGRIGAVWWKGRVLRPDQGVWRKKYKCWRDYTKYCNHLTVLSVLYYWKLLIHVHVPRDSSFVTVAWKFLTALWLGSWWRRQWGGWRVDWRNRWNGIWMWSQVCNRCVLKILKNVTCKLQSLQKHSLLRSFISMIWQLTVLQREACHAVWWTDPNPC